MAEQAYFIELLAADLPRPEIEYRFHPERRWRFDLAWPAKMIAAEIEGGIWTGGRHVRGRGYEADLRKYNQALLCGWDVYRFSYQMVSNGEALETLRQALGVSSNVLK